jgi:Tfp pilus assembly protein PilO
MNAVLQQFLSFARRYPLVVSSFTLFSVLLAANYFLWQRQQVLTARHEEASRNGEAMLLALNGYSRISTQLATVQEALGQIESNLIAEGDLAENLGYFYQMETRSQVRLGQLNQLSSQPPAEGNPFKSVPFSLRVTGTYPQIIGFLHELESGPRLARFKNYNFSRSDPKSNALTLDLTVELLAKP